MSDRQVLEFRLNGEQYCTDIDRVSEIVRRGDDDVTPVPDAPSHVEGVMDLRGEMTEVVDPRKRLSLDVSADVGSDKILVFSDDGDDDRVGWLVADVTRVSTIDTDDAERVDQRGIKGIINRDEGFLMWTTPDAVAAPVQTTP